MAAPIDDPACYPGDLAEGPMLVSAAGTRPLALTRPGPVGDAGLGDHTLDGFLTEAGVAATTERTPVLAVGSNACPAQLARKLALAKVSSMVPLMPARVTGLRVGHSAHVSRPGYVPAVPVHEAGASSDLCLLLLDRSQVEAIDRTEPSYLRVVLDADRIDVRPGVDGELSGVAVYAGRRGSIAPGGTPIGLCSQVQIHSLLRRLSGVADSVAPEFAEHVRRAASSAEYRSAIRWGLAAGGHIVDVPLPAA